MLISPDFGQGGSEHSISKLSVLLSHNYEVHFVVFNKQRESNYVFGGTLHSLEVGAGRSLPEKLIRFWQRVRRLKKLKKELQIQTSISFLEGANYVNVLSASGDKIIVSVRGSHTHDEEIRGLLGTIRKKVLMPWCYSRADHVVAVSDGVRKELETEMGILPDQIFVINNAYSVEEIVNKGKESLPSSHDKLFDRPVIVAVGRLHPQKNYKSLLKIAARLKKEGVHFRLIVIGDGDQLSTLLQVATTLGLTASDSVQSHSGADLVFAGYQENPWSFVSRAQVFVLASLWEGFPNALAEAMCLGVPVVATDCPHGPSEILSPTSPSTSLRAGSFGVLIPSLTDEASFVGAANVLKTLLADASRRETMGKAGQERMKMFSEESSVAKWSQLIRA